MDVHILERPNAKRIQLGPFYDYRTNVALYPAWQAYLRDLPNAELVGLDTGRFAVEDKLDDIVEAIVRFDAHLVPSWTANTRGA